MKQITAELMPLYSVSVPDANLFKNWIAPVHRKLNFDADTLTYPRSCMAKAGTSDETLMMVPFQPVVWFESMAKKPELSDMKAAMCMWQIGAQIESAMNHTGMRESYFLTNDAREAEVCSQRGWKKVLYDPECKTWLMKLKVRAPDPMVEVSDVI